METLSNVIGSQEAAKLLNITTQHVKRLVTSGDLHGRKISLGYVFLMEDVLALRDKRGVKPLKYKGLFYCWSRFPRAARLDGEAYGASKGMMSFMVILGSICFPYIYYRLRRETEEAIARYCP